MNEQDLITGLADIEQQLKDGNGNQKQLLARLGEILAALRKDAPAPQVNVPISVEVPLWDWRHDHEYDGMGRCIRTISTRFIKGQP